MAATGSLASAAAASNFSGWLTDTAEVRAGVTEQEWRAVRSFNPCALDVFAAAEKKFAAMLTNAGEAFSVLASIARRRRIEAEAAAGSAEAAAAVLVIEKGKG